MNWINVHQILWPLALAGIAGASQAAEEAAEPSEPRAGLQFVAAEIDVPRGTITVDPKANARRNAYFGDLHVHTDYSFDAFLFGTVATPHDAYRYAKGEAIQHAAGFDMKLRQPLDFYAVTDHAMFLGAVKAAADTSTDFSKLPHAKALHDLNASENQTL